MVEINMSHSSPEISAFTLCYTGTISIGNFRVPIRLPIKYWSLEDYFSQWQEALHRIKRSNSSCLIVNIQKGDKNDKEPYTPTVRMIVLYKKNDIVIIQRLHFSNELYNTHIGESIIPTKKNCYNFIPKYSKYYPIYPSLPQVFWELNKEEFDKKFSIKIIDNAINNSYPLPLITAQTIINSYKQKHQLPVNYWSIHDYKQQWNEGIMRLQNHNSSCLITRISEPMGTIGRWLLYKRDGKFIFYYDHFYGVSYPEEIGNIPLTKDNCYDFIPDEQEHLKKYKVKEWQVPLSEFDELKVIWPEK